MISSHVFHKIRSIAKFIDEHLIMFAVHDCHSTQAGVILVPACLTDIPTLMQSVYFSFDDQFFLNTTSLSFGITLQ